MTSAPPPLAYLLVFLAPALEAGVFVGFVLSRETAVLLCGVIASQHRVNLAGALVADVMAGYVWEGGRLVGRWWRQ